MLNRWFSGVYKSRAGCFWDTNARRHRVVRFDNSSEDTARCLLYVAARRRPTVYLEIVNQQRVQGRCFSRPEITTYLMCSECTIILACISISDSRVHKNCSCRTDRFNFPVKMFPISARSHLPAGFPGRESGSVAQFFALGVTIAFRRISLGNQTCPLLP